MLTLGVRMKKIWGVLFVILGIFLAFLTPTTVQADKYKIEKYHITANVQKNGDVDLTQKINYAFDGDFHGVYYNQSLKNIKGITDPKVDIYDGNIVVHAKKSNSEGENTYKVTKSKDNLGIKVYREIASNNLTFVYKYRLKGVVINYNDTALMNWTIIDNWDDFLKNIKVTINLPQENIPQLKAWGHGPLNGDTTVNRKKGQVILKAPELVNDNNFNVQLLFPTSVTPLNGNVQHKDMKKKVLAHEKKLVQQANHYGTQQKWIYRSLMVFGLLVILTIYAYKFIDLSKHKAHKHVIPTPLYHYFDEPRFLPSFCRIILERTKQADSLSLTADLMNEVGQRRMKIEKVGRTYEITALVPPTNPFFKYLIEDIGDGKKVSLRAIRHEAQDFDGKVRVDRKFEKWSENAAIGREKYLDLRNMDAINGFKIAAFTSDIIAFIMLLISLLFGKPSLIIGILLLALGVLVWLVYWVMSKKITPYTDLGEEEVNKIRAFKKMLEDINDIKLAEVGDIVLWEQFIPYAVAFGVSDKVIHALKVNFTPEQLNQGLGVTNYFVISNFVATNAGFQSSFIGALGAGGSASISGGSGGFSGGGMSGGFGGGSGGAF